jgi:hypothetical protein
LLEYSFQKVFVQIFKEVLEVQNFFERHIVHLTAEITYVTEGPGLFEELERNLLFLFDFFENLFFDFHRASVIDDSVVHFFVIFVTRFSQFDLKADESLVGNVVVVARKL